MELTVQVETAQPFTGVVLADRATGVHFEGWLEFLGVLSRLVDQLEEG